MSGAFISYRRDDAKGVSLVLRDRLVESLGVERVFLDGVDLHAADRYPQVIEQRLRACDVLVVLIDQRWNPQRLHDPEDWVAWEIATALQLGKPVVPVLIDGARLPGGPELPPALQALASLQTFELRTSQIAEDAWALAGRVARLAGAPWPPPEPGTRAYAVVAGLYALLGTVLLLILSLEWAMAEPVTLWIRGAWFGIAAALVLVLRLPVIDELRDLSRTRALELGALTHGAASLVYTMGHRETDAVIAFVVFGAMPAAVLYFSASATRRVVRC